MLLASTEVNTGAAEPLRRGKLLRATQQAELYAEFQLVLCRPCLSSGRYAAPLDALIQQLNNEVSTPSAIALSGTCLSQALTQLLP